MDAPVSFDLRLPDLTIDAGEVVSPLVVRGWTWGPDSAGFLARRGLSPVPSQPGRPVAASREAARPRRVTGDERTPVVLVVHALTGDSHAGGEGGWWGQVIGPGRPFDPARHRILCFNHLGSCYGTTGPADEGFPDRPVTTWDLARATLRALDGLGVARVALATGGSLGGMVTLSLAALAPERFERIVPIAACAAASSWIIGFNHVQRRAIALVPDDPAGLALARQIAMLTYRAEAGLDQRQGRRPADPGLGASVGAYYRMQTYLDHQGHKLVHRFTARAYIAMMDAMDHHDLERPPRARDEGEAWTWPEGRTGFDRIRASCMAVGIDSDQLFFPVHSRSIATKLAAGGGVAELAMLTSLHGHDGFLIEWDQLDAILRRALDLPAGSEA